MDSSIVLIVAILGFVGFAVLGFAAYRMMRGERGKPDAYKFSGENPAPAALEPAARPTPPGAHEVLRVLRDDLTGRLMLEIGGQRFNRVMEIQDPNLGRGLVTTVRDLQRFMQGQVTGSGPAPEIQSPAPGPVASAPPPPAAPARVSTPEPPHSFIPNPAAPPSITMPSMNPFKQAQILRELSKQQLVAPKSIPDQIDEILQEKIAGTALVGRGLKVNTSPAGGVVFYLDGQTYDGVDAVPDPDGQAAIRAAVKAWENKQ
jgi:hypothetical protein